MNASDTATPGPGGDRRGVRRVGTVTSDRMAKTIIVRVDRTVTHPVYKKIVRRHTRLVAHDEKGEARIGDTVEVVFTRPISATKRWRLVAVVKRAPRGSSAAAGASAAAGEGA